MRRRHSKILDLPKKVIQQVNEMIVEVGEGRRTYEEISAWLKERGHDISKSAVGRYAKYFLALEKVKFVGEQAKSIIEASGQDPLKIEEATSKLGAVVMMEVFQEAMKGDSIDVKHIGKLMGDFARLQMSSVAREKLKDKLREKFEKAIKKAAGKRLITKEEMRKLREQVL